jgi:polysaccharide biosynthesis/export protein
MHDENIEIKSYTEAKLEDYRLKPLDELYIQISSQDAAAANLFSSPGGSQSSLDPYGASLLSYLIDKEGFLELPIIGSIMVKGNTLDQVKHMIVDSLSRILSQPVVTVKLVNKYVSVLGEVQNPGHFIFPKEKLTIYDALSLAGDIKDYGNRHEMILTRNENGKNNRIIVDLTKADLLSSGYYYLKPNDIVYVKPLRKKFWGMREFPFNNILSTITTALLIYSIFTTAK